METEFFHLRNSVHVGQELILKHHKLTTDRISIQDQSTTKNISNKT